MSWYSKEGQTSGGKAVADIPPYDILCAAFLCQPFSIAGVSKELSLGWKHSFEGSGNCGDAKVPEIVEG